MERHAYSRYECTRGGKWCRRRPGATVNTNHPGKTREHPSSTASASSAASTTSESSSSSSKKIYTASYLAPPIVSAIPYVKTD